MIASISSWKQVIYLPSIRPESGGRSRDSRAHNPGYTINLGLLTKDAQALHLEVNSGCSKFYVPQTGWSSLVLNASCQFGLHRTYYLALSNMPKKLCSSEIDHCEVLLKLEDYFPGEVKNAPIIRSPKPKCLYYQAISLF